MKNRFISLILVLIMITSLFAFSACSNEDNEAGDLQEEEDRKQMTVDLWIPYYPGTTQESIDAVAEALNEIAESKYTTHIEFHFIPSDSYEAAIQARLEEVEENKELEEETETEPETDEKGNVVTTEPETIVDEYGFKIVPYPAVSKSQMDIFLVRGFDNYFDLAMSGYLSELDSALTEGDAKKLKTYIYPSLLQYSELDEVTYGIPNNTLIGEMTAMLVSKDAIEQLNAKGSSYKAEDFTSLISTEAFISDVASKLTGYTPVRGEFTMAGVHFWNEAGDSNAFSLVASQVSAGVTLGDTIAIDNVFNSEVYVQTTYMNKLIKEKNYVGNGNVEKGKFAVATVTGTREDLSEYEDQYYIVPLTSPTLTQEAACRNLFAVSAFTRDMTRSIEIITLLNTNEKFRTILQYGVEGVHWKYSDDKTTIVKLSDTYKMKLEETGNAYLTYPDYGKTKDSWTAWKNQNLESTVDPFLNFNVSLADVVSDINKSIASKNSSIASKRVQISDLEKQIKEFDKSTQTDDDLNALKNSLAAAERSIVSTQASIAEAQLILNLIKPLTSDSAAMKKKIDGMTAAEFKAQVATLRQDASILKSVGYLTSVETYNDYVLCGAGTVIDGETYYKLDGNTYKKRTDAIIGRAIPEGTYQIVERDASYSLASMYADSIS